MHAFRRNTQCVLQNKCVLTCIDVAAALLNENVALDPGMEPAVLEKKRHLTKSSYNKKKLNSSQKAEP